MDKLLREATAVDAEQKKQEWAAEKKQKEEVEKKRRAEESMCKASVESAKQKAGLSKGNSKEVVVESDDDSEGPEFPKTKSKNWTVESPRRMSWSSRQWYHASGKSSLYFIFCLVF
jgi:hypothetical protein